MRPLLLAATLSTLLLLDGCGHPAVRGPGADDPCLAAGHNLAGHEPADPPPDGSAERARLDARLAAACRADGWSPDLITCMTSNVELEDYGACRPLLSEVQFDHLEAAWRDPGPSDGGTSDDDAAADAAGDACNAATDLGEALLAASGPYTDERVVWSGATGDADLAFQDATRAIEGCRPGAFGPGAGGDRRRLWAAYVPVKEAFDPRAVGSFTDRPAREILLALVLLRTDDGERVTLTVSVSRDE